jgi:hypothetical protein
MSVGLPSQWGAPPASRVCRGWQSQALRAIFAVAIDDSGERSTLWPLVFITIDDFHSSALIAKVTS